MNFSLGSHKRNMFYLVHHFFHRQKKNILKKNFQKKKKKKVPLEFFPPSVRQKKLMKKNILFISSQDNKDTAVCGSLWKPWEASEKKKISTWIHTGRKLNYAYVVE